MKTTHKVLLAGTCLLASGFAAHGHGELNSAYPQVGSTVREAPSVLMLNFNEGVEPAFSSVRVTDAEGRRIETGKLRFNGRVVQVSLPLLLPGKYNVHWRVVTPDTHRTEGSFGFEVRP